MAAGGASGQLIPRPDQVVQPARGANVPGQRSGTFRGRLVVIFGTGPNMGVFVYSPTPATGNLVASIAAAAGTDPYGNAYLAGVTSYGGAGNHLFAQLLGASLQLGSSEPGTTVTGPGSGQLVDALAASSQPGMRFTSPLTSAGFFSVVTLWGESQDTTKPPQVVINPGNVAGTPATAALLEVQGQLAATRISSSGGTAAAPSLITTDTAQAFSFNAVNGWVQAAGRKGSAYKLLSNGDMEIVGSVTVPAAPAANQAITNAAAAVYQPQAGQSLTGWVTQTNVAVRLFWTVGGILQFSGPVASVAAGNSIDIPCQRVNLADA